MILDILKAIGKELLSVIDQAVEDKDLKQKLQAEIKSKLLSASMDIVKYQSQIIQAEAKSESWLTRTWRPIVMLTFTVLIVADWLGYTAPNLSPELKLKLFDIIHLGLGGYVIGRSFEKTLPRITEYLDRRRNTGPRSRPKFQASEDEDEWL